MLSFARTLQLALAASSLALSAQAAPVASWSTSSSAIWSNSIDFESAGALAANTGVANQFQSLGVSFTGTVRANSCGTGYWDWAGGMSGTTLNTYGPGCTTNSVNESFSMKFDGAVTGFQLDAYLYDYSVLLGYAERNTFSLYNNGVLVGSVGLIDAAYTSVADNSDVSIAGNYYSNYSSFKNGLLTVDGGGQVFDEVRYTEVNAADTSTYLAFDNLRFNAANDVPEPASLALVGVGLLAAGAARRRRR